MKLKQLVILPHSILHYSRTLPTEHHMIFHIWFLLPHNKVPHPHVKQDCSQLCQRGGLNTWYHFSSCRWSICMWRITSVANFHGNLLAVLYFVRHQKSKATVPRSESEKITIYFRILSGFFYNITLPYPYRVCGWENAVWNIITTEFAN